MKGGYIQAGNFIFSILLVLMAGTAGYFYFFANPSASPRPAAKTAASAAPGLAFTHPVYGYSLSLPYGWKNNYEVRENGNRTEFWHSKPNKSPELIMSVARYPEAESPVRQPGDRTRPLGTASGLAYILDVPGASERAGQETRRFRREIEGKADMFASPISGPEASFARALAPAETATSSVLAVTAYEILGTQERTEYTDYYLWRLSVLYSWKGGRLFSSGLEDGPVRLRITDGIEPPKIMQLPSSQAKNLAALATLFPSSVAGSAVMRQNAPEHAQLMERLEGELEKKTAAYFGHIPSVWKVGVVQAVSTDEGVGEISLKLYDVDYAGTASASPHFVRGRSFVSAEKFTISSSTRPLAVPSSASSAPALSYSWRDWTALFGKRSTSTWKMKPFWFSIQEGTVLEAFPF